MYGPYGRPVAKYLLFLATVALLLAGVFGVIHLATAGQANDIGACPFLVSTKICTVSSPLIQVFAMILLLVLFVASFLDRLIRAEVTGDGPTRTSQTENLIFFSPLKEAFSSGIIHSKAY